MQEKTGPQSIELVRDVSVYERQHPTHVLHTRDLGAQRSLRMKVSVCKITKLLCPYLTLAMDADTAGTTHSLASHVLGHCWTCSLGGEAIEMGVVWSGGYVANWPHTDVILPGGRVTGLG